MALTFLLDTNILSEPVRPHPHSAVIANLEAFHTQCALAATSWHELLYGVYRLHVSRRRAALEAYLHGSVAQLPILPFERTAAAWLAGERARLASVGKSITYADGQIAAIAATHGLTLVTRNTADFSVYASLTVVNWFDD